MKSGQKILRVGFWQNGFFADFYFWAAGFVRGFCRRIFSPHFCGGKSAQKNPPGKSPAKSSRIYTTKIPDTFLLCRGPDQKTLSFHRVPRQSRDWADLAASVRACQSSRESVVRRIRRPKLDFGQSILFSALYSLETLESIGSGPGKPNQRKVGS